MRAYTFLIIKFLIIHCSEANKENDISSVLKELLSNYEGRFRPNYREKPLLLNVSLHINGLSNFRESDMDFDVSMNVKQYWNDKRLAQNKHMSEITLSDEIAKQIWIPDTYIVNQKSIEVLSITDRNKFLRLSPNGDISLSQKINAKLSCDMDLRNFPLDTQYCSINFESYSYNGDEVDVNWKKVQPFTSSKVLKSRKFENTNIEALKSTESFPGASYPKLILKFELKRLLSHYILNHYIPTTFIICLSWISFWINARFEISRTILAVSSFLAILVSSANSYTPEADYVMALDVWNWVCIVFAFTVLIVHAFVVHFHHRSHATKKKDVSRDNPSFEELTIAESVNQSHYRQRIDRISRIAFPILFFIFLIIYSLAYL